MSTAGQPDMGVGVVVDINVYLHAMSPGHRFQASSEQALLTLLDDDKYQIATSEHILDNIYDKLKTQMGFSEEAAAGYIAEIEDILTDQTQVLDPDPDNLTDFISDREDNNILALAADSDAKLIVTNDFTDLVSLGSWRNIPILPATKFNEYARTGKMPPQSDPQLSPGQRLKQLLDAQQLPTQPDHDPELS